MNEGRMNFARLLAVIAVSVGALAVIWVMATSLGGSEATGPQQDAAAAEEEECNPKANTAVANGYYTIKEGDLLSLIAERTCLSEQDLQRLNPGIDPQALTPGSCVSLEEGGCEAREEQGA